MLYRSVSYINRLRTRNQAVPDQLPTTDGGGGSKTYTAGGGTGNVRTTRQRTRAKCKTAGVVERPAVQQPDLEGIYEDDEEPDIGKTLHAKDGKLGYVTNKGFIGATNFLVDIESQVHSEKYLIKGIRLIYFFAFPTNVFRTFKFMGFFYREYGLVTSY